MRPERPSEETMDFPDIVVPTPPHSFRALSPEQNQPSPLSPNRVSQDQDIFPVPRTLQGQDVPSQGHINGSNGPAPVNKGVPPHSKHGLQVPLTASEEGFPLSPSLPNQEGYSVHTSLSDHPESLQPGLHLPSFVSRKLNTSPLIPAQMQPGRSSPSMNKFHFDQESPYPIHMSPSLRYSSRPVSPSSLPTQPHQAGEIRQQSQAFPDKDKSTRRSILKTFQKSPKLPSPLLSCSPIPSESRSSVDRTHLPSFSISRSRRPSFHSTKSSTTSNDIPPSLQIQNSPLVGKNGTAPGSGLPDNGQMTFIDSATSRRPITGRSVSPTPVSTISSRSSVETRPSFDASQFEIVSPKTPNLTYPYHELDH